MEPRITTKITLPPEEVEKEETLQNVLSVNPKMTSVYQQFPKWFYYVLQLEGLPKSRGRHAAGTIIAPKPVVEYAPLYDGFSVRNEGNIFIDLLLGAIAVFCLNHKKIWVK